MANCKEKANEWRVSERAVTNMCKKGKIPGAIKNDKYWEIPEDAKRPTDGRVTSGKYINKQTEVLKRPSVGMTNYIRVQSSYYYVDKTLMIKEIIDSGTIVSLFTRPRRFGKTLNMDMLKVFFEKTENDTSVYFKDKKIWKCGNKYTSEQGKYPVIFLTFKDINSKSWAEAIDDIAIVLSQEFLKHSKITNYAGFDTLDIEFFNKIKSRIATVSELKFSLKLLSKMLAQYYGENPIIIVDEYDTPIQEGYIHNYYDEIVDFMKNLFSGAFKDNPNLTYGFMTGILRVSKESIFSGLNNVVSYSILSKKYDNYFGFTQLEIDQMLNYYKKLDKKSEIKEWYDGYIFGETEIYNPWSVINYIEMEYTAFPYWTNTSSHGEISKLLTNADENITKQLLSLMDGKTISKTIHENITYKLLSSNSSYIFDLLLMTGYLTITEKKLRSDGFYYCNLTIPNKELRSVYKTEIADFIQNLGMVANTTGDEISDCLDRCDIFMLKKIISEYISKCVSFYDTSSENFYHGLLLGFLAVMDDRYIIKSNRESGNGRYDICLFPINPNDIGIIIELKYCKNSNGNELDRLAKEALRQIEDRSYDAEMKEKNITDILKMGIAFEGKSVSIHCSQE